MQSCARSYQRQRYVLLTQYPISQFLIVPNVPRTLQTFTARSQCHPCSIQVRLAPVIALYQSAYYPDYPSTYAVVLVPLAHATL